MNSSNIYVIKGHDEVTNFTWLHSVAFKTEIAANKEAYSLTEASKDEQTGLSYKYTSYKVLLID